MATEASSTSAPEGEVTFCTVRPTLQESSAKLMHYVRTTLQRAQEITQVVADAEQVADEATKYCEAIRAQQNIKPKKFVVSHLGDQKPQAPQKTTAGGVQGQLAPHLTKQIQSSVMWTQTMLEMVSLAENRDEPVEPGTRLTFLKRGGGAGGA